MPFSRGVRVATCLASTLLLGVVTLGQTGHRASRTQLAAPTAHRDSVPASAARREWDASRDWLRFTTHVLGDTGVTDSMKALLSSGLDPATQDRYGRTAMHAAA